MIGNPNNIFQKTLSELGLIIDETNISAATVLPDGQILTLQQKNAFPKTKIWDDTSSHHIPDNVNFLHFTRIESLKSIIKNKNVRLYNFNNMFDPIEFDYAARVFELSQEEREKNKQHIFSLSGCATSLLKPSVPNGQIKFNLWRLFGDLGEGAIIEFKIENKQTEWKDFHIGKINYGPRAKQRLKKIYRAYSKLRKEHQNYYEIDFRKLFPFYKSNFYEPEHEIRILYDYTPKAIGNYEKYSEKDNKVIFPNITEDTEKTFKKYPNKEKTIKYISLPITDEEYLRVEGSTDMKVGIPKLKIHKIILGFQYKGREDFIRKEMDTIIKSNLDYNPQIEFSRITKSYW